MAYTVSPDTVEGPGGGSSGTADTKSARRSTFRQVLRRPAGAFGIAGALLLVLVAIFGPLLAPYNPDQTSSLSLAPPSLTHLMGTDQLGRDVFSRLLVATRISVIVGLGSPALALVIGGMLGMLAGMAPGRWWDTVIMRLMDVLFSFPVLVLVPVLSGLAVGRSIRVGPIPVSQTAVLTGAIAIVFVPVFARVVRGSVLGEMGEDYITAARSFGARRRDLIFKELLPNIQGPLIVQATFSIPLAIVTEAAISFLGFGIQPPAASWGDILSSGLSSILRGDWWQTVFPALAIGFAVLSFNLLGDTLRDVLEPGGAATSASILGAKIEP